jgi:hypothetical protein
VRGEQYVLESTIYQIDFASVVDPQISYQAEENKSISAHGSDPAAPSEGVVTISTP